MILRTPARRLALVFGLGVFLAAISIHLALRLPRVDFQFRVGDVVSSEKGQLLLEPHDLREEPGEIETLPELTRFYDHQDQFSRILSAEKVHVERAEGLVEIHPQARTLSDLSGLFWTQVFVAFGALVFSGWIWAIRPKDLASLLFAISGLAVCLAALTSAIYTTREGGIPSGVFRILEEINAVTASLFGICMIGLFLIYPIQLRHWKKGMIAATAILGFWTILSVFKISLEVTQISLIMVTEMLLICLLVLTQYFATKNDPRARASLTWLGLSVLVGSGAFIGLNTLPTLLGITPLSQGYAFLFFLIIYLGLAAGLTQYRLFEVGQWAFRLLFYAGGALLLGLVDSALVFGLGMERFPAMGLSLLAVGFVYLPIRDFIWRTVSRSWEMESHESLEQALHVAFAPSDALRASRWEALIRKIFDPLEIKTQDEPSHQVEISDDGLTLMIPSVANTPALKIAYPRSGRSLFTKESKSLAQQIVVLITQAESSRKAYDRGVAEERRRMAQDLHDDVGARLLSGLHHADEKFKPVLQGAIAEIRSIVSGMTGENIPLEILMADLRHEAAQRLSLVKMGLDWPLSEKPISHRALDYRQQKALRSAMREVVSNVIRHSGASELKVRIQGDDSLLRVSIADNGKGFVVPSSREKTQGFGLHSLRRRLADAGGTILIDSSSAGTLVVFEISYRI